MSTANALKIILQMTWGLPQNLLGLVIYFINRKSAHFLFKEDIGTVWNRNAGLSSGLFIFVFKDAPPRFVVHEYAHSVQSLILGPLYIPVIAIPSFLWCNVFNKSWKSGKKKYSDFYTEVWAEAIADDLIRNSGKSKNKKHKKNPEQILEVKQENDQKKEMIKKA